MRAEAVLDRLTWAPSAGAKPEVDLGRLQRALFFTCRHQRLRQLFAIE